MAKQHKEDCVGGEVNWQKKPEIGNPKIFATTLKHMIGSLETGEKLVDRFHSS